MKTRAPFNPAIWLTFSRFILVPVFIYYFLIDNFKAAVIALVVAACTDVLDGLLARRFNFGTKLGSVLDPLADKFLMMVSFIVLSAQEIFPPWLAMIVIGRDFYIIFGAMYLYFLRQVQIKIKPTILSKRTTFSQFMLLTFSFIKAYLIKSHTDISPDIVLAIFKTQNLLIYLTAALTLITFVQYTNIGYDMLKNGDRRPVSDN
ncbi:MAG: CDP-alcohol phosphatidyltransferase family protein [Deltaproteobacteria bacterium]|nr:CDP-alcohol phosphatidyltransferase family protein [Deltaproteobacteria bacterium]